MVFRRQDEWLIKCIDRIVEAKTLAGMRTTASFELVRLAKNGLTNAMTGSEIDRKVLGHGGDDVDSSKAS